MQISKVTNKLRIEPKQKDQTFMLMEHINRYIFLNWESKYTSVSIHTLQDELI